MSRPVPGAVDPVAVVVHASLIPSAMFTPFEISRFAADARGDREDHVRDRRPQRHRRRVATSKTCT
jgi:hypothetical protein